jgi:hypothetical protein
VTDLDSDRHVSSEASSTSDIPRSLTPNQPDDDGVPPLIVEERLRVMLVSLVCLRRMTRLALEPTGIPLFSDIERFARFTREWAGAQEIHVQAIRGALPLSATNLAAPAREERS